VVDISSFDAILYISYKERSRHMVSRLSRVIIISILSILSLSMLQGCSSLSTKSHDGAVNIFNSMFQGDPRLRPWDPPAEIGYGARIPNMRGDVDKFCKRGGDCG